MALSIFLSCKVLRLIQRLLPSFLPVLSLCVSRENSSVMYVKLIAWAFSSRELSPSFSWNSPSCSAGVCVNWMSGVDAQNLRLRTFVVYYRCACFVKTIRRRVWKRAWFVCINLSLKSAGRPLWPIFLEMSHRSRRSSELNRGDWSPPTLIDVRSFQWFGYTFVNFSILQCVRDFLHCSLTDRSPGFSGVILFLVCGAYCYVCVVVPIPLYRFRILIVFVPSRWLSRIIGLTRADLLMALDIWSQPIPLMLARLALVWIQVWLSVNFT